ncbi:hypothetical protein EVAR_40935_1 [Eumeta japonica]|uniref:Uncharacterized protein n=1 Tax=Eumeta variegata TaxID=151549 RepID=A0A4C1X3Q1_EUMVA|nr:hypothetical protein EVAR_40935_1 [Eumeta japonica]
MRESAEELARCARGAGARGRVRAGLAPRAPSRRPERTTPTHTRRREPVRVPLDAASHTRGTTHVSYAPGEHSAPSPPRARPATLRSVDSAGGRDRSETRAPDAVCVLAARGVDTYVYGTQPFSVRRRGTDVFDRSMSANERGVRGGAGGV